MSFFQPRRNPRKNVRSRNTWVDFKSAQKSLHPRWVFPRNLLLSCFGAPRGVLAVLGPPGALQGPSGGPSGRFSGASWGSPGALLAALGGALLAALGALLAALGAILAALGAPREAQEVPKGSNLVPTKSIPGAPTSNKKMDQPGFEPGTFGSTLLLRRCLYH